MRKPVVHLYATCYDESLMLPYFYRNYDSWIEHFFIYDNGSTDESKDIVRSHPSSTLHTFEDEDDSHEASALRLYNSIWKNSRGSADWVMICDIDEHLYHPNILGYLAEAKRLGVTATRPQAYEMVADDFPETDGRLSDVVTAGVRLPFFDKLGPFDPDAIEATGFGVGRHVDNLSGRVVLENQREITLLHYKQLGADYVARRHAHLSGRLGQGDIRNGWSLHWAWDNRRIQANHRRLRSKATPIPALQQKDKFER